MIPQLLNIKECAERLRIPVGTIRNWCSQKRIPYVKVGGRCLFDPRELERWLEGSTVREQELYGEGGGVMIRARRSRPGKVVRER